MSSTAKATERDYYDRERVTVVCEIEIKFKRGSERCRQDALRQAVGLDLSAAGVSVHGCYGAQLVSAKVAAGD